MFPARFKKVRSSFRTLFLIILFFQTTAFEPGQNDQKKTVFVFKIKEDIMASALRKTTRAFEQARQKNADYILVHMDTYGGLVNVADSIREIFLSSPVPIMVFIDGNAASAGALICIAADSIYMKPGSSIGAASVVNQQGEIMPEKYQSFMRSKMKATAESHGKDTVISGNDTIVKWRRDPRVAEAMVDPRITIPGIIDSAKILTFTTEEALENGYSEGTADNIQEVLDLAGLEEYEAVNYQMTSLDKIISFLLKPVVQSILIMLMLGGIYFELQSPGIGFPLGAAVAGAVFYFMPLYLEGLAANWEIAIFVVGLILIGVEIFAIPGFGVAGISGIILAVTGLTLSMVDNIVFEMPSLLGIENVFKAFFIVVTSMVIGFLVSLYITRRIFTEKKLFSLALHDIQETDQGFVSFDSAFHDLVGKSGVAQTVLRPSGKVEIEGELYDAQALMGYIAAGEQVKVVKFETGQLHVIKKSSI